MIQNRMSRELCYTAIKMDDELYHHGVDGMSWGNRNGPPYPLRGKAKKIARAEAKRKIERDKKLAKMRKLAAKKRKVDAKEKKKQQSIDKLKEKLLREGDIEKIKKYSKYFTNEELEYARMRNAQIVETKFTKGVKTANDPHTMERMMDIVGKVGKVSTSMLDVVKLVKGFKELEEMSNKEERAQQKAANDAVEAKIKMLMTVDPDAAAKFASKVYGESVSYSGNKPKEATNKEKAETATIIMKMMSEEETKGGGKGSARYKELQKQLNSIKFT